MCHSAVIFRGVVPGGGSRKPWRSSEVISRSWVERNTFSIARMTIRERPLEPFLCERSSCFYQLSSLATP